MTVRMRINHGSRGDRSANRPSAAAFGCDQHGRCRCLHADPLARSPRRRFRVRRAWRTKVHDAEV